MNRLLPNPLLDGELLRAFIAFAEEQHVTRAALRVGLSQPALSERLTRLSALAGVQLVARDGRRLVLTEEGRVMEAFARDALRSADAVQRALRGGDEAGTVTLTAGEGTYLHLLHAPLRMFAAQKEAELVLRVEGASAAMESVAAGRADLGVMAVDALPRALESVPLRETKLVLLLPEAHPLAAKRALKLSALSSETLILPPEGRTHRAFILRALGQRGITPRAIRDADGWPLMVAFASMGLGLAVVNEMVTREGLPKGLVARPLRELGTLTYHLVRRRGRVLPKAADVLSEFIVRALARSRAR
jgi:DNA-binding transcriptional LysR family regulator